MFELSIFPTLLLALMIDVIIGDPKSIYRSIPHPTQLMGWLINYLDTMLNDELDEDKSRRIKGVYLAITILLLAFSAGLGIIFLLSFITYGWMLEAIILSTLIASRSLYDHVLAVSSALKSNNIEHARSRVGKIVSREVKNLDRHGISRAAIESLSENFSDGVVAPIFWAIFLGLPGVLAYKMLNTADSMIGYKNDRYHQFGWAAARLDDLINFIPARLSALLLFIAAFMWSRNEAERSWIAIKHDAKKQLSINAGYPESAMAGALNIRLAGPRDDKEQESTSEWIGIANESSTADATDKDIDKGLLLYVNACLILISACVVVTVLIAHG
jgi:adenosylcobinamide-phosphate synthase